MDLRKWGIAPWVVPVGAGGLVAVLALGAALGLASRSSPPGPGPAPPPTSVATAAPSSAPTVQQRPAPSVPTSVPAGTWAKIPRPGEDLPDTGDERIRYMANIAKAVPGEPPLKRAAGLTFLQRLKAEMAKNGSVPVAAINVSVGETAGSIVVAKGTKAQLEVKGAPKSFGVCSEMIFAASILLADLSPDDFAKAGVRAVICKSDGCTAAFDMRPTSSGGAVYGGEDCLSLADALPH